MKSALKFWVIWCCLLLASPLLAQQPVRIGIGINPADLQPLAHWTALAPALTKAIHGYNFMVVVL